jgi:hypothetical protein
MNSTCRVVLSLLCLGLPNVFVAGAQESPVLSPQAIIVNPVPSYEVEVFVDKDPSGGATPSYAVGESIRIGVRVSEDAYVYLFNVRSDGSVNQILPNNYDAAGQNNFVRAGETKYFPPEGAAYAFEVNAPEGLDKVIAVASEQPLDTSTLATFESDPNFASSDLGEEGFADALSVIVTPLPQEDWVSDTALFYVGAAEAAAPLYGTLSVTSSPSGARVMVDGVFVGYTPQRYGTSSGDHTVSVELEGYDDFESTVSVTAGQTVAVRAPLSAQQRLGQVGFESNPSGAQVYVDDQLIGTTPTGTVELAEGTHQARFVLPGFDDTTLNFTVSAGSYQLVSGELRSQQGTLELTGNVGGALVFIDGQRVGTIPSGSGRLTFDDLAPGTHEITVTAPGFNTFVGEFEILPGQSTSLTVSQTGR